MYLVVVLSPRLQPLHDAVEDEPGVPPPHAVVGGVVAHLPLLVGPRLRRHLLPLLLVAAGEPVPHGSPPSIAAHEHHPHLVHLIRECLV
jgi:hypothetical protein